MKACFVLFIDNEIHNYARKLLLLNSNEEALNYAQQSNDIAIRTKADGLEYTELFTLS